MASNIVLFGGSGKVARHITRLLAADGHNVYSVIRNPDQKPDIESLGGKPIVQSIEDSSVDAMTKTIRDAQAHAVIWSAGAGAGNPARTKAVDHEGAVRSMDATAQAGVQRYIMVSAIDVRDRENRAEPAWYDDGDRERSSRVWGLIGAYMEAKLAADRDLVRNNARRGLEYTIVRPTRLSEEPARGKIDAGKVHTTREISREDVARVVVEVLKQDGTKGLAIDCVGGEVPIPEAIAKVATGRVDSFEGHH